MFLFHKTLSNLQNETLDIRFAVCFYFYNQHLSLMYSNAIQGIPVYIDQNSTSQAQENIYPYENQVIVNKQLPQWANGQEKQIEILCQFCKRPIITLTKQRIGKGSLVCSLILIFTFPFLFWLPCFKESCQDVVHLCPNCGHLVGEKLYKPCS